MFAFAVALVAPALTTTGCTDGYIGGSRTGTGPGNGTPGAGGNGNGNVGGVGGAGGVGGPISSPLTCKADVHDPGDAPLRLLTQEQYLNTVNDLFGTVNLDALFPRTDNASQFGFAQGDVDQSALDTYQRAAGMIGSSVVSNKTTLDRIAPCAAGGDQRACAKTFLMTFGSRTYRAPFAAEDLDRHLAMYDAGVSNGGYAHGIELMLRGMLQSPRFLYRVELGTADKIAPTAVKLSGYELAARLSYGLWNTTPDTALVAAAAGGTLSTPAGVAAELQRMLKEPRGNLPVRHFLDAWIHLGDLNSLAKDATRFPDWNAALRASMIAQAGSFFDDVIAQQNGTLTALLTSPTVFVDKNLAPFYGMSAASATAGSFQKIQRTGIDAGMLTLPAFLATQSKAGEGSPIYRGKFVREQLLCQELPPPPPDVPPAPDVTPGTSTRERLAQHETNPACAGCHKLMDPIGFGLENYDGIGKYRTTEAGKPIDASGLFIETRDLNGTFVGASELTAKLAKSPEVEECVATQWFRYAMGRFEKPDVDGCSVQAVVKAFRTAGNDLRALPLAIVQTDAFLYRRPIEVKP
ncbi:MAG TPA: DUF1592 domain-containing protein [Polyangia bacterium]|jgi:hypothetical protein|nr:DUF1592 domain-containing protein [Polyangia bacterium]